MILLLRKIRKAMIDTGLTGKYFIYATGEVALVVIGILIALQINNWNQEIKDRNKESLYLNRLLTELKTDTSDFGTQIEYNGFQNHVITNFSSALNDPMTNDSLLIEAAANYFDDGWSLPTFNPRTTTFYDISTTGNLDIITNENLRTALVHHYTRYEEIKFSIGKNLIEWINPTDSKLISDYDVFKYDTKVQILAPPQDVRNLADNLRSDSDVYLRNASGHFWINTAVKTRIEQIKKEGTELITLIEQELNNS